MSQHYCFDSPADRFALFSEGFASGWISGALDFPHFKRHDDIIGAAEAAASVARSDVCCIVDETAYMWVFSSGWATAYTGFVKLPSERLQVTQAAMFKCLTREEAVAYYRRETLALDEPQAELARAYAALLTYPLPEKEVAI